MPNDYRLSSRKSRSIADEDARDRNPTVDQLRVGLKVAVASYAIPELFRIDVTRSLQLPGYAVQSLHSKAVLAQRWDSHETFSQLVHRNVAVIQCMARAVPKNVELRCSHHVAIVGCYGADGVEETLVCQELIAQPTSGDHSLFGLLD